jgi:hypothetical protein
MTPEERALEAAWKICTSWDGKITKPVLRKAIEAYIDAYIEESDTGEVERLRAALREILDPISGMRARMNVADGEGLNGQMAITLSNSPEYLKQIARAALYPQETTKS